MPPLMDNIASFLGIGSSSRVELSDDERSSVSAEGEVAAKPTPKPESKKAAVRDDDEEKSDEEDDDDEVGEDEYVVEKILSHMVNKDGKLQFEIKWEGYEKKSERTWEPEENLETAQLILDAYLAANGGKKAMLQAWKRRGVEGTEKKGKKRGRSSTANEPAVDGAKRGRKNGTHPLDGTPPASADSADFKPPSGSWEEEVVGIDACEGHEGAIIVFLTWKNGVKSQHALSQVYKRCPQKMLKFYESHLVFKRTDDETANSAA